jgi:hypothetical protein
MFAFWRAFVFSDFGWFFDPALAVAYNWPAILQRPAKARWTRSSGSSMAEVLTRSERARRFSMQSITPSLLAGHD